MQHLASIKSIRGSCPHGRLEREGPGGVARLERPNSSEKCEAYGFDCCALATAWASDCSSCRRGKTAFQDDTKPWPKTTAQSNITHSSSLTLCSPLWPVGKWLICHTFMAEAGSIQQYCRDGYHTHASYGAYKISASLIRNSLTTMRVMAEDAPGCSRDKLTCCLSFITSCVSNSFCNGCKLLGQYS